MILGFVFKIGDLSPQRCTLEKDKKNSVQIHGELAQKLNEWLLANALSHSRHEILEVFLREFGVSMTKKALQKRENRLGIKRDLLTEQARGPYRQGNAPNPEHPPNPGGEQSPPPKPAPTVEDELAADRRARRAQREHRVLNARYQHLLDVIEEVEAQRDEAIGLRDAPRNPIVIEPKSRTGKSEAVAVAVASDWHIEEPVEPSSVNGMNEFNLEIAEMRAKMFFERTLRLVKKERQDVKISTLVLGLLGDFITGNIHEEMLVTNLLKPMDAMLKARDMLEGGIRFLLENSDLSIVCVCCVGNHSRITKKVYAASEHGFALEWMMYHDMRRAFANEERVQFVIEDSYHTYLPIYDYLVRFHHGHAVRYQGGVGGLTIPLNKAIAQWNKGRVATLDVIGHWHQYMPARQGGCVVNGSLIGYNGFALRIKAGYEDPTQAFFLIDRDRGVTCHWPILFERRTRAVIVGGVK